MHTVQIQLVSMTSSVRSIDIGLFPCHAEIARDCTCTCTDNVWLLLCTCSTTLTSLLVFPNTSVHIMYACSKIGHAFPPIRSLLLFCLILEGGEGEGNPRVSPTVGNPI